MAPELRKSRENANGRDGQRVPWAVGQHCRYICSFFLGWFGGRGSCQLSAVLPNGPGDSLPISAICILSRLPQLRSHLDSYRGYISGETFTSVPPQGPGPRKAAFISPDRGPKMLPEKLEIRPEPEGMRMCNASFLC